MEKEKCGTGTDALNSFRGWLLFFLIVHIPIALYNVTTGVYALANYLKVGAGILFSVLALLLCLLLPAALLLLARRKPLFRWFYVGYCAVMAANYLLTQGVRAETVAFAAAFTLPWLLYVFLSRRVRAVLAGGQPVCSGPGACGKEDALD